jgi:hypothetical protein
MNLLMLAPQLLRNDRARKTERVSGVALRALKTVAEWNATVMELVLHHC